MSPISQQSFTPVLLYNQTAMVPSEGPKAVPISIDFANGTSQTLDYGNMQRQGFISMCQTVFIDNSNSDQSLTVAVGNNSQQSVIAKGRTQGYYALVCPNPIRLTFTCADDTNVALVQLLNYPVQGNQWATQ